MLKNPHLNDEDEVFLSGIFFTFQVAVLASELKIPRQITQQNYWIIVLFASIEEILQAGPGCERVAGPADLLPVPPGLLRLPPPPQHLRPRHRAPRPGSVAQGQGSPVQVHYVLYLFLKAVKESLFLDGHKRYLGIFYKWHFPVFFCAGFFPQKSVFVKNPSK
jgi:hypothetical protein